MFSPLFIYKYLNHQLNSSSAHGIHSPFVYKFYTELLNGKDQVPAHEEWEKQRSELEKDDTILEIVDLGAGSLLNNSNRRKVSSIAANALKPPRLAGFLYRLTHFLQPAAIIELGTSLGITSLYMAGAAPDACLHTIEGSQAVAAVAAVVHAKSGLKNIQLLQGSFDDLLPELISSLGSDNFLLYIDGNHQKDSTLRYFELALTKAGENTVIIFDDIHWSAGMEEAWAIIKAHPRVSLSIDIFFMGIVFFKQAHTRQDFRLLYW